VQERRLARALSSARRGDVTGVHRARVASRRLREMLPLTAGIEHARGGRRLRKDVRRVTVALGAVRELDVTRALLASLDRQHAWTPAVVLALLRTLDAERRLRLSTLAQTLRHIDTAALLRDVRRIMAGIMLVESSDTWRENLDSRRRARAAALAASLRVVGTLYVPDRLHEVRLAAKKLRYALEVERAVRRSAVAADLRTLEAMQERLGHLHDLQILLDRLRAVMQSPGVSRSLLAGLPDMCSDVEQECRTLHGEIVARIPRLRRLADRRSEG